MKTEIKIILPEEASNKAKGTCFEELTRNLLSIHQYKISQNINFSGIEIDLIAEHKHKQETLYVECKAKEKVSSDELTKFCFNVSHKKADSGYFFRTNELEYQAGALLKELRADERYRNLTFFEPSDIVQMLSDGDFIFEPDGKIVAVGNFQTYDGTNVGYITRIHTNGDLDTSFNPMGTGGTSQIQTIVIQNDGKFIIGGNFNMFNNQNISKLIRLNSDGTIDNSFVLPNWVTGTSVDAVLPILNTTTNELDYIVGGNYRSIGGVNKNGFTKINSNANLSNNEASFETQANFVVYPNPTNDIVNLNIEIDDFVVKVFLVRGLRFR